jgi:PAS domain S-box-containing protein
VVITDTRGNIEYVNPKFTRVTGYSPHEAIGRNPRILKSGHQPPEFYEELWDTITAGEEWRGEFCNRKKNGEVYWELASISPIRNGTGNTTHYLKVAEDVTARREMEEALRHSEQRYRTVFDHAGDAIFVHDMEGQFLDVNQIACQRLGYSRDELLEMSPTDITVPDIEQLQKVDQMVFETAQVRRDGTSFPVEINSRYIEYDGQPAILSIARDITTRKAIEQKIERYAADLERSNQELEQFAYVVSHDLQEPLRMVKSYMELLERRYREQLDEKANMFIDYAVDGAQRMQEMIKGMLDLSRIGTRGNPLAPTDVEAILDRTLNVLGRTIEETGAEVTHEPLPTVMADKAQLAQVFQNLVANGIKFRREDVPPRVHISAERADGAWLFSVEDNGIGIDPKQSDRIFQVFQRLHTQEEYEGTGIGLALCKRIVERHSGRIWVESKPGEGSTFKFTIPVETEAS